MLGVKSKSQNMKNEDATSIPECHTFTTRKKREIIMSRKHRLGVNENTLVTRKLKINTFGHQDLQRTIEEIDNLYGLDSVSFDNRKQALYVAYDALRLCIEYIEEILTRHGIEISRGWWNRFKEEYYRFVDQNIKDNAAKDPWNCH